MPIVEHADVRRMLVTMRAQIAAMRALAYWTAAYVDRSERHPDAEQRRLAAERVALLTPLVKAWLTDLAQEITANAILVHGGMGYVEETGAAQHFRDARILAIYEGTNGIQAMDLVGRKLDIAGGQSPWRLFGELREDLPALPAELQSQLAMALGVAERTTRHLQTAEPDDRAAGASPYLRLLATMLGGFLLARGAKGATNAVGGAEWPGLARFYLLAVLPPALALEQQIIAGARSLNPGLLSAA